MEQAYWLRRTRASVTKAKKAACSRSRLAHFELAGRYSILAVNAAAPVRELGNDQ